MKKYSIAWKMRRQDKFGGWAQYHGANGGWRWHYIANATEYRTGSYLTKADCEQYESSKQQ